MRHINGDLRPADFGRIASAGSSTSSNESSLVSLARSESLPFWSFALNPFAPFGDCSLVRMATLYANIAQVGSESGLASCLDMVTAQSAKLLNLDDYGIAEGKSADIVLLDAPAPSTAIAELAQPVLGIKRGVRTFTRALPELHRPQ